MSEWLHTAIEVIGVAGPIVIYMAANKRSAKADRAKQHHENTERLDELINEQRYLPPHDHVERQGPLQAEGIIRRKANGK